jgi:hypothetical protein
MLKIFDHSCPVCGALEERMVSNDDPQYCECGAEMLRQVPGPSFKMPGYRPVSTPKAGVKSSGAKIETKKIVTGGR